MNRVISKLRDLPLSVVAGLGSAALLLAVFGFQYLGGLAPCILCLYQRWPHALALCASLMGLRVKSVWLPIAAACSTGSSAAIGVYHTGVELGMLAGPTSCSGGKDFSSMTAEDALAEMMGPVVVSCDAVVWQFAGLSMSSWNVIASTFLTAIWIAAASKNSRD